MSATILAVVTVAVVCQFTQTTDDVFPLQYFTVDSALFAGAVAMLALARPLHPRLPLLRLASAVAVLLSGLIYATVIAPASQTGTWIQPYDDYWVRTSTFLLHLVAPVLVTIDALMHGPARVRLRSAVVACFVWPLLYIAILGVLASSGWIAIPYPFLDPRAVGAATVASALTVLAVLIVILGAFMWAITRRIHRVGVDQNDQSAS